MPNSFTFVQNTGTPFEENKSDVTTISDLTVQLLNLGSQPTNGAAYGSTIDTSADVNQGTPVTVSDYDKIQVIFRDASTGAQLFKSAPLDVDSLEVADLAYAAAQQQVTEVDLPDPDTDESWTIKVVNEESGQQPYEYRSVEIEVVSGDSVADAVDKFIDQFQAREDGINDYDGSSVYAGDDQEATVTVNTFNAGDDFTLTIDGTGYTETAATDQATTFTNFVDNFQDSIFSNHGVRVSVDSNDDLLLQMVDGKLTLTDAGDLDVATTGSLDVALTDASTKTLLRLEAKDLGDIFSVATQDFEADSITVTQNPTLGQGTYEYVKKAEEVNAASSGRYVQQSPLLGKQPEFPTYADSSGKYDLLTLTADGDYEKAINKSRQKLQYTIALESAVVSNATGSNPEDFITWFDPKIVAQG